MFSWLESLEEREEDGGVSESGSGTLHFWLQLSFLVVLVPPQKGLGSAACLGSFFLQNTSIKKMSGVQKSGVQAEGDDEGLPKALGGPWDSHC